MILRNLSSRDFVKFECNPVKFNVELDMSTRKKWMTSGCWAVQATNTIITMRASTTETQVNNLSEC